MLHDDGVLYIVQGDDIYLTIDIWQPDGITYELQTGDYLQFSIKPLNVLNSFSIKKTSNTNVIIIPRSETKNLIAGRYSYDIKLYQDSEEGNGIVSTIIEPSPAVVLSSVGEFI